MLALVLTTPIFTRELGMDGFGIFALISTLLGMNGLAAFGLADATTKFVAEQSGQQVRTKLVPIIQTSCALYLALSVLSGLAAYFLASGLIDHLFHIDAVWRDQAITSVEIGALAFALRILESFFSSISLGYSRYDLISKVDSMIGVILIGVQSLLLLNGYGIVALTVCIAAATACATVVKLVIAKRLLGDITAFFPRLHASQTRRLMEFSFFTWLQSINQILGSQMDRLLVASLLSTQALSYYVVCTRIASLVQILPAKATSFIFPLVSEQHAAGQISRLRKTYFTAQNGTIALSLVLAVPLFLYAPAILTIWLGENVAANATSLLRILVVTYTLLAGSILPFYYLNGAGMPGLNAAFGWAGVSLNLVALLILLPGLQVIGAAAAKLVAHSLSFVCYPILHRRVFMDRRWYVGFLVTLPPLIVFGLLFPFVDYIGQPVSLAGLVLAGSATAALTAIAATLLVFAINPVLGTPFLAIVRQVWSSIFPKHRDC